MDDKEKLDIKEERYKIVRKSNDFISKTNLSLTATQQKILNYLISKINPFDDEFKIYTFDVIQYAKVAGIDFCSGKNYNDIKNSLKELADKSNWVKLHTNDTINNNAVSTKLLRLIQDIEIVESTSQIKIRFSDDLKDFLLKLRSNYTEFELIETLNLKSKYAIRLYEIIKSFHFKELEVYEKTFEIAQLKELLNVPASYDYTAFKNKIIIPAVSEINQKTDKLLSYKFERKGNKYYYITLAIASKSVTDRITTQAETDEQLSFFLDDQAMHQKQEFYAPKVGVLCTKRLTILFLIKKIKLYKINKGRLTAAYFHKKFFLNEMN